MSVEAHYGHPGLAAAILAGLRAANMLRNLEEGRIAVIEAVWAQAGQV